MGADHLELELQEEARLAPAAEEGEQKRQGNLEGVIDEPCSDKANSHLRERK